MRSRENTTRGLLTLPNHTASGSNGQVNASSQVSHSQLDTSGRHPYSQSNATSQYSHLQSNSTAPSSQNGQSQRLMSWPETTASTADARANNARPSRSLSNKAAQHHSSRLNAHISAASGPSYSSSQISLDPLKRYTSTSNARSERDKQTLRPESSGNAPAVARPNANLFAPISTSSTQSRPSNALVHRGRDSQDVRQGPGPLLALPSRKRDDSSSKFGSRPDLGPHGGSGRVSAAQLPVAHNKTKLGSPPGGKAAGVAPQSAKGIPQGSEARAATSVAQLGDMTRSYLEGMVPRSEVSSLLRYPRS